MGLVFERICREYLRFYGQEQLGQPAKTVGQIWAADYNLDVVAELLGGEPVFGGASGGMSQEPICGLRTSRRFTLQLR